MSGIVRNSKVRHVFGQEARKENSYEGFRATNCAFEGVYVAANENLLAFSVEVGGSGAFSVIPVSKTGRLDASLPKVSAHKEYVLDLKWNPFDNDLLASCSEDGSIRIWEFDPVLGCISNIDDTKAVCAFEYHEKRCVQLAWHPIANNILMSVSQEPKICIWNLDEGCLELEFNAEALKHSTIIYNAEWSSKGDKIVACSKDKKFRVYKARFDSAEPKTALLLEGAGHEGSKPSRVVFTFNDTMLFSCGFSKMSERQFGCWKLHDDKIEELEIVELDTSNGCLIPYVDADTKMVYLGAKGDTVIRYYEITEEEPYYYYISTFQSKETQKSLCFIPKRSVDVNICEMMKFYKLSVGAKVHSIKPLSFTVPRKSELFQDDLYPPAISIESAQNPHEWIEGNDATPNRVDMSTFFKGKSKPKGLSAGGGLKKSGGLKGLKAKKEAKEAAKKDDSSSSKPAVKKTEPVAKAPSPEPAPVKPSERNTSPSPASSSSSASSGASAGADPKVVKQLQNELKSLKDNEKKMQKEIKSLTDKLKDYDKLTGDIKLLCDAVKKNDERLNSLEALVQEESETEED